LRSATSRLWHTRKSGATTPQRSQGNALLATQLLPKTARMTFDRDDDDERPGLLTRLAVAALAFVASLLFAIIAGTPSPRS